MPGHSERLDSKLSRAVADRQLMESAAKNIHALLGGAPSDLYLRAVSELVDGAEWSELNDRFYQTLAFGTGGLRGRTIGKIVTRAERGDTADSIAATGRPEFPCVGTNAMNFFNISRATQGLVAYLHDSNRDQRISERL
jgi:phosphoglucomutase